MSTRRGHAVVAVAALLALPGCGQETQEAPAESLEAQAEGSAVAPVEEPEWGYEGEVGPASWADLDPEYAACGTGRQQSPIDLSPDLATPDPADAQPLTFDYAPADFEVDDLGHTTQAQAESAGGITIGGERYELAQVHVHAPSEHALAGERTDLSVHLVHRSAAGELAVVGVFVEPGEATSGVDTLFADLPTEDESVTVPGWDPATLLPDDRATYRYDGSLTTPPCTEGVRWLVMPEIVTAAPDVVSAVAESVQDTARPLQPIGDREVALVSR